MTAAKTSPSARTVLRPSLIALACAAAWPVHAQQATESTQLDTVVITATKRPQPLQSTPIAVSVISGGDRKSVV